jgi:Kef-type K+ transport system membrane component KefB
MVVIGFELMAALVIGSIALATAPVLVLSITQQYRTRGPVTRTVLPLVAIDDVLAVATFGFVNELFAVFATTRAFRAAGEIRADGADATPE